MGGPYVWCRGRFVWFGRDCDRSGRELDSLPVIVGLTSLPGARESLFRNSVGLGPGEPLRRAVWYRSSGDYNKTALAVLERYPDPRTLKKLGRKGLATLMIRASRGAWREAKADELLAAADETLERWAAGGLDFAELADDIASEVPVIAALDAEIAAIEDRVDALYDQADPGGIVRSAPGLGVTPAAGILGRTGDLRRFAKLAGVRSFTGIVPKVDQSGLTDGHNGITNAGDPGLRQALYLAADRAARPTRPWPPATTASWSPRASTTSRR